MRQICSEGHALAIARWEDNHSDWLEGGFYGLASNIPDLQQMVGHGGTLWVVVSRKRREGGRLYTLSFRLDKCKPKTYRGKGSFGKYGILGDPNTSTLFATSDARLLLMSLRFYPTHPIEDPNKIGQSIQKPRCLSGMDVALLSEYAGASDRWSVFVSYGNTDARFATRISESLQTSGVSVFRDKEALLGGRRWWNEIKKAIAKSRRFVLLVGPRTHESEWVRREVKYAIEREVAIVPVMAGGNLDDWSEFAALREFHAIPLTKGNWPLFMKKLVESARLPF